MVIDEAEEILLRGFKDTLDDIYLLLPKDIQTCLFTTSISEDLTEWTQKHMCGDLVKIVVESPELSLDGIRQYFVDCQSSDLKLDALTEILGGINFTQVVVYCNTTREQGDVVDQLKQSYTVGTLNGSMSQDAIEAVLRDFRKGETQILVSTTSAIRNSEIAQISAIINFSLAKEKLVYIERLGRTGKYGRQGLAITLVDSEKRERITELEQFYSTQIDEIPDDLSTLIA